MTTSLHQILPSCPADSKNRSRPDIISVLRWYVVLYSFLNCWISAVPGSVKEALSLPIVSSDKVEPYFLKLFSKSDILLLMELIYLSYLSCRRSKTSSINSDIPGARWQMSPFTLFAIHSRPTCPSCWFCNKTRVSTQDSQGHLNRHGGNKIRTRLYWNLNLQTVLPKSDGAFIIKKRVYIRSHELKYNPQSQRIYSRNPHTRSLTIRTLRLKFSIRFWQK